MIAKCRVFGFVLAAVLVATVTVSDAAQVTGTATYRERMALPPDAVFEATLEDVSRADAPAVVVGKARIERPGQPPIRFGITYDAARIDPRHSYAVRSSIKAGGEMLFTTTTQYRVITGGSSRTVSMMLTRVARPPGAPGGGEVLGRLPADFVGTLPCRGCAGTRYQLRLLPFEAFYLAVTERQEGRDVTTYDIGSWGVSPDRRTLRLQGGRDAPWMFAVRDSVTLRAIDGDGRELSAEPEHDLRRTARAPTFEPRLMMRGMYRYMADAGVFTECATGQKLAVAQEEANAALEREYGKQHQQPGDELLVSVEGRITTRPRMEGAGEQATLVVERVVRFWPGESCGGRFVTASLEGTRWRLTRLGHEPVIITGKQKEPWMALDGKAKRITGHGGCNRMSGSFERDRSQLRFGATASTKMACADVTFEDDFFRALEATRSWRVTGTHLELLGEDGALVARFEARDL